MAKIDLTKYGILLNNSLLTSCKKNVIMDADVEKNIKFEKRG